MNFLTRLQVCPSQLSGGRQSAPQAPKVFVGAQYPGQVQSKRSTKTSIFFGMGFDKVKNQLRRTFGYLTVEARYGRSKCVSRSRAPGLPESKKALL